MTDVSEAPPLSRIRAVMTTCGIVACVFAIPRPAASEGPASQPATDATPPVGPITYYVANCARCHGDVSAPYVGLDHPKRGKALKNAIDQMADGPGNAPLDAAGLDQQAAMHEAIFGQAPFAWVNPARHDVIAGEVLPGTTLAFEAGDRRETPTVTDNRFEIPRRPGTLTATRGTATVRVPIPP